MKKADWKINKLYLNTILMAFVSIILWGCSSTIHIPEAKPGAETYAMFGSGPERAFFVPVNIGDTLKLRWEGDINGGFAPTSITAYGNYVFVPDLSGRIYAFDAIKGKELGFIKFKGSIIPAPIVEQFVLTFPLTGYKEDNSVIYNYNFHSGQETAKFEVQGKVETEPVRMQDGIVFLTEQGKAIKYSSSNEKLWEFDSKGFIHSSAASSGDNIVFGNDKGIIFNIDAKTGSLKYQKNIGNGFEGGFAISGDTVFTADNSGTVYCFRLSSGDVLWKYATGYKINVFPVSDGKYVYIGNLRGDIYKLQKNSGKLLWKVSTDGVINTTPLLFKDYLVQPDLNKKLHLINVDTGHIKRTMNFEGRNRLSPVYYGGTLFLGIDNGKVMAYESAR
ncbi:MAG: PQQ-binding-like beta-propeller repeat protein [Ignavibacteria bacterium]|nr:PQQ-binding-like beta-propeller repeat protein [Ignavibacteria bacterium]MCU7501489.1 PQQ-binding-like beta-propeller repeat protein [Ignavibacteria bacterium]MCU7515995.1 PQQ-binding-like beta-propeller repeat protein [Ignavibacteria bacterium]